MIGQLYRPIVVQTDHHSAPRFQKVELEVIEEAGYLTVCFLNTKIRPMQVTDVTAIITGAGRGLGLAFTRAILTGGGRVLMTDIDSAAVEAAARVLQQEFPDRVHSQQQDVTDLASFDAAFDAANRAFPSHPVNVLVNNAGIGNTGFYTSDTAWTNVIAINTTAVIRGTQPVVVNIASMAGLYPLKDSPDYSGSKAAVVAFSRAVGMNVNKTNVRVVALCPGFADTQMGQAVLAHAPAVVRGIGGLMTPDFVASALVLRALAEQDNSGQVLVVSKRGVTYHGRKLPAKL
ncbi:hypothetical protein DYB25_013734 [Aphanomyces astaci]|uniref:Uncharacterized protein n=2 Tax=Aphanomyces astaci TaxID=112090 RepID=A0A396ZWQ0_APHAT|nr:hypothetical protein DYB25_013734 [Aphanomyces astaci]RHY53912.1 hypothetical protein DYB34_002293 [Aphanomyces astaci]RHZ22841.1 hypothetical protein DYB31_008784 [Aphanomyces astaci]